MSGVDKEGAGVLYLIGLGLGDEKDITVAGLEVVKRCRAVYLEAYTSILGVEKSSLEVFYGRPVELMDREAVEQECDSMLEMAKTDEVAFLVVGDVYGATTHTDIAVRARDLGVKVKVIHNASIMNACGACGLQLYNFGQTVSICFFTETWRPDSFIDKVLFNKRAGLHTLCLLDIKVKEQSEENMARGRKIYEPPRFMTVNQSLEQILEVLERRPDAHDCLSPDTLAVGLARVGQTTQCIASGPMRLLKDYDFGGPLHSMIIPGDMHYLESDMLRTFDIVGNPFAEEASEATGASAAHATSVAAPAEASAPAATEEATPQEGALEALEAAVGRRETIAELAVRVMGEADPDMKAAMTLRLRELWMAGKIKPPAAGGGPTAGLQAEPARPAWVKMVDARKLKQGSKVAFVHSLCHAESYAIDLMWDIVARFAHERLPEEFFDDWTRVAADEARHYSLWRARLKQLGSDYGHLTAHDSLWQSAAETAHGLLPRLAVVHMVHEARGLDVAALGLARFRKGNPPDEESARILQANVADEVTHVGAAVKWFTRLCERDGCGAPAEVFHATVQRYFRGALKPPFNEELRAQAGMTPEWYLPLAEGAADAVGAEEGGAPPPPEEDEEVDAAAVDDFFDALNA